MYEIRVQSDFSAAHFLKDYNGKCENLHGHNYRVYAHAKGEKLDGGGMLIDFSKLKGALKSVCNELDHTNLNDMEIFFQNPSAERISKYIFEKIIEKLLKEGIDLGYKSGKKTAWLYAVDVFETDTSRARYTIED